MDSKTVTAMAKIMAEADGGGCPSCAGALLRKLDRYTKGGRRKEIEAVWGEHFDYCSPLFPEHDPVDG